MDGGAEGVCKTCAEERSSRRESSAFQREYVVETVVARCNYCRAGEDETTTLDHDGYCEACRALPRCIQHGELIAVGHCKTCRREFCRKCLGFTDVCQDCTAKNKTKPLKEKAPTAGAAAKSGKIGAKKAKQTSPMVGPAAAKGKAKSMTGSRPLAEPESKGKKKAALPPSRGRKAMEEKLVNKSAGRTRSQIMVAATALAVGILVLISGAFMHAMSPEEQAKRMREQMITVHKGVVHYMKKVGKAPKDEGDIRRALSDMKAPNSARIVISFGVSQPSAVIYKPSRSGGFIIQATNERGELLQDSGTPFYLDQYFDSSSQ